MNWLITIGRGADLNLLMKSLLDWGCELDTSIAPITAGQFEILEVTGPPNLPELASNDEQILEINPNSTMTYF